ncbi:Uncharacterised protein [Mycobacteroides abscessus subsp. abscessus]|nr:Uncharacterised protein [Mycobacteroides abscessus subsp. abscessus]SIM57778.1 Uncharacterised protein [Mycobacteroides abscessus subsp. abscessus]
MAGGRGQSVEHVDGESVELLGPRQRDASYLPVDA